MKILVTTVLYLVRLIKLIPEARTLFGKKKDYNVLKRHLIFRRIDEYVKYIIPNLVLPARKIVYKDMLIIKFQSYSEFSKKNIHSFSLMNFQNNEDFYLYMMEFFTKTNEIIFMRWRERDIPKEAIDKFDYWHENRVIAMEGLIRSISYSQLYNSYSAKVSAIMDCLSVGLALTILDAEKTIKDLNGHLDAVLKVYNETQGYDWD